MCCWFLIKDFQGQGERLKTQFLGFLLLDLKYLAALYSCLEAAENIIKACVALHNCFMANKNFAETNSYCPNGFIDQDVRRN